MYKPFLLITILLVGLTGCAGGPASPSLPPTVTAAQPSASRTAWPPPLLEFTSSPTATRLPTTTAAQTIPPPSPTAVPTLASITPEVVQVCPNTPEVPLEKLGLENFYLVVRLYDPLTGKVAPEVSGAVVVPLDQMDARVIPGSQGREGWELIDYKPAAGGRALELVYAEVDGDRRQVWHSTWDGQQQWQVAEYALPTLPPFTGYPFYYYRQIGEHWYATIQSDLEANTSYPTALYNWATGETREVPAFPEGTNVNNFFWLDGALHMDYYQGMDLDHVMLYNLETFTALPVFQWLAGKDWVHSLNTFWHYRNGRFTIQVIRNYGVDLGLELDLNTILSDRTYEEVMQAFYLPGPETYFLGGGFFDFPPGYQYYRYDPDRDQSPIYFLDFRDLVVREYCYAIENFSNSGLWTTESVSPDRKFVVYNYIELGIGGKQDKINRVEIFNFETGEFATIPNADYEVIGWGRK